MELGSRGLNALHSLKVSDIAVHAEFVCTPGGAPEGDETLAGGAELRLAVNPGEVYDSSGKLVTDQTEARVADYLKTQSGSVLSQPPGDPLGAVDVKVTEGPIDNAEVTSRGSFRDWKQFVRLQTARDQGFQVAFYYVDADPGFFLAWRTYAPNVPIIRILPGG